MKKKILLVQNLLFLSAALSLAIFTTSCDREEDNPVMVTPSVDGNGGGTGGGDDGGGGGEFVDETLTFTVNDVTFTMKPVPGGTFYMGAQKDDPDGQNYDAEAYDRESPVHQVTLSSYYMGETEVTQALWLAVMSSWPGTAPSSTYGVGDNYPAYYVSWDDIQNFLTALNTATASQRNGRTFALPTEAQWEYAACGGNKTRHYKYAGSNDVSAVAYYGDNSSSQTHPAGMKQPNELGLYDMSGNVWEWCSDWYGDYSSGSQTNPQGPASGSNRVLRGGSWLSIAGSCRVSYRGNYYPGSRGDYYGFRLVLLP